MNIEKQKLKMEYIPLCVAGKISIRKCAEKIGITPQSVCRLKNRYKEFGSACFFNGNLGRAPKNKRFDSEKILNWYNKNFAGAPFAVARDYYDLDVENVSYSTVYNALASNGVMSPKAHKPIREKKKHLPRKERPQEGDLIQIDASKHNWFLEKPKTCIHGGIDDATHKITSLIYV